MMLDSDVELLSVKVTSESVLTTPTQETIDERTRGVGGVAVQRRERAESATESPVTSTVTTGGGGASGGKT